MTDAGGDPVEAALEDGRTRLRESEGKRLLADHGLDVPEFAVARTPAEAVEAAESVGYPAVVKLDSAAVGHKSEWAGGAGVHLGCGDAEAVRNAAETVQEAAEDAGIEYGVLVERAVDTDRGVETLVGCTRDPTFGPTLVFGLGGTLAEVVDDVAYRLAPISAGPATAMTAEIRGTELLEGFRGAPPVDRDALADAIVTLGDVLVDHELAEIEVNPLLATGDGTVALDALVVLDDG